MTLNKNIEKRPMITFDKTITVEISVDNVAKQLLDMIKPDEKHGSLVAETIVGVMLEENRIGSLYNVMQGFTNEINFAVDDIVLCKSKMSDYKKDPNKREQREIGECTVKEINIFSSRRQVLIEYTRVKEGGEETMLDTEWVGMSNCDKIPTDCKQMA